MLSNPACAARGRSPARPYLHSCDRERALNILHAILSDGFFGSERYCIELAVAQARAGHRVGLLIQNRNSAAAREFRREADAANDAIVGDGGAGRIGLFAMPSATPNMLHR